MTLTILRLARWLAWQLAVPEAHDEVVPASITVVSSRRGAQK